MTRPTTVTFTSGGQPVQVHAIRTGTITIKKCHHTCCLPERSSLALRLSAILADRRFADPLPIWTFAVEHPGGVVVIDAGATPDYNDPASWARDERGGKLIRSFIRIAVEPAETLPAQLAAVGISPAQVASIVLTHQHIDHTAAVPAFPTATVWTTQAEDDAADRIGAFPWRWRNDSTNIQHIDTLGTTRPDDPTGFGAGIDLTTDGTLRAFHTPGHTPGSVTIRLTTDQRTLWFTGDTSFTAAAMNPDEPTAGIHADMKAVRALHAQMSGREVLLPSHDWDNTTRLQHAAQ